MKRWEDGGALSLSHLERVKAKIENIVEAFQTMKDDLDREKRAMEKMWSAREKQLSRVIDNTARLYGDMQGLIGSKLEKVDYLELESGE